MLANEISELCREVLHMRNHYPGLKTARDRVSGRFSRARIFWAAALGIQITAGCAMGAQVSSSAYRALGQADLRRNGVNGVQGLELNSPLGVALDRRGGQTFDLYRGHAEFARAGMAGRELVSGRGSAGAGAGAARP